LHNDCRICALFVVLLEIGLKENFQENGITHGFKVINAVLFERLKWAIGGH
jgi:hypothetical protein